MPNERQLTELEGAVLTEIHYRGNDTAYKVRRAFQTSFSVQWRGSAGAVSPAAHRLEAAGLIRSSPHPTRNGKLLELTGAGQKALRAWAKDVELACGVGMDPFRLRSGIWPHLPPGQRDRLVRQLRERLEMEIAALSTREHEDLPDRIQSELAIDLLNSRIAWLRRQETVGGTL